MSLLTLAAALQLLTINPLIPMTAITGKPDRGDVTDLLCAYNEVGIEQFLIYPRSGLEIEYMSDEWFRFCRDCIEVADSLGMKVWLYDEYNWPSGNCKGQVTADGNEDCYPKVLYFDRREDGSYTTRVELNRRNADILDPKAVSRFINLTHERYYAAFGKYFGNVIPAIFCDEIVGYSEVPFSREHFGLTWYDGLEKDYAEASGGRDLHADVAAFLNGEPSEDLWRNYYDVYGKRLRDTFIEPIADWCRAHGIELTGHLMYEKLYKGARCNGNNLKCLSLYGIPGFDEANSDIDVNAREMEVSGLALVQYASRGRTDAMCELYSVGPGDLTMSHQRQLMWMCSEFGVNNYIVAVSAMDARGNKEKGDWYFSSGRAQPWFDYYREFGAEAYRAAEFARKPYTPQVLVRVPSRYFGSLDKTRAFEREGIKYLRFLESLLKWQVQFFLLDEDEEPAAGLPVLSFGPDGFFVEGESQTFWDQDKYMAHVTALAPRDVVVYEEGGSEARDIMVRRYDDGAVTLVDMTDKDATDRILTVRTPEGTGKVRIQGHGAFAGFFSDMDAAKPAGGPAVAVKDTRMRLSSPNLVRCMHTKDNPEFRFSSTCSLKNVRIIVRTEVDPVTVCLDGKPLTLSDDTPSLPEGFHQLYRASVPLTIPKGEHVLSFNKGDVDLRFLPSAFIAGDFSYERSTGTIGKWTGRSIRTTDVAPDYTGTYDIDLKLRIPAAEGTALSLGTNLACTEVLIDGKSLGRKGWGPFEWDIPEEFLGGNHKVTVRISNSIMPLFGDIRALDKDQPYVGWLRIKPGQHGDKTTTGIFDINFIQK